MTSCRTRLFGTLVVGAIALLAFPGSAFAADGAFDPTSFDFGNVVIGHSMSTPLTFANTSGADVTVTGIAIDDPADFSLAPGSGTSCDTSPTIPDQATCVEQVVFDPASYGAKSATLTITFSDTTTATAAITGYGVHPVLHITSTTLSPKVFYPLVRDGFRDFAAYRFTLNEAASGAVQIFNRNGKLTRSFPFANRDHFAVAWGGVNRFGSRVKPGFYRFRVTAHLPGRRAVSGFRREQVKTGFRLRTTVGTKTKRGIDWSARSSKAYSLGGSCNWGRLPNAELLTTCLAAHASVTYRFVLPRGARVTLFSHVVRPGIAPCRHKVWTTGHTGRIHRATFTHGSVNGFSQCDIGGLSMRYRVTRKIRI
jgi:hypothetical protein